MYGSFQLINVHVFLNAPVFPLGFALFHPHFFLSTLILKKCIATQTETEVSANSVPVCSSSGNCAQD